MVLRERTLFLVRYRSYGKQLETVRCGPWANRGEGAIWEGVDLREDVVRRRGEEDGVRHLELSHGELVMGSENVAKI